MTVVGYFMLLILFYFFRVKTKFAIVDPAVEAAHARLIAMRTGRYISSTDKASNTNGSVRNGKA